MANANALRQKSLSHSRARKKIDACGTRNEGVTSYLLWSLAHIPVWYTLLGAVVCVYVSRDSTENVSLKIIQVITLQRGFPNKATCGNCCGTPFHTAPSPTRHVQQADGHLAAGGLGPAGFGIYHKRPAADRSACYCTIGEIFLEILRNWEILIKRLKHISLRTIRKITTS